MPGSTKNKLESIGDQSLDQSEESNDVGHFINNQRRRIDELSKMGNNEDLFEQMANFHNEED